MEQLNGKKKERPDVLGQHTAVSIAKESGKWKDIPFAMENAEKGGMLPPNLIVVGDKRRVMASTSLLYNPILLQVEAAVGGEAGRQMLLFHLDNSIKRLRLNIEISKTLFEDTEPEVLVFQKMLAFLQEQNRAVSQGKLDDPFVLSGRLLHRFEYGLQDPVIGPHLRLLTKELLQGAGRVDVAIGIYVHERKPLPLVVLETQMGMSAQDIIAWEALVNSDENGYTFYGERIPANSINVIRAGTCGGIIMSEEGKGQVEAPFIDIGDMIVANASIADGAVARQRMGCWTSCDESEVRLFKELWKKEGLGFTGDGKWPLLHSSRPVVHALAWSCAKLVLRAHFGTNSSKESLYMEGDEHRLKMLRSLYLVFSSEMEHFGLAYIAHLLNKSGIPVQHALISTVVGTVPGGSFALPGSEEEKLANANIQKMLEAAMLALWKLTYDPWRPLRIDKAAGQNK